MKTTIIILVCAVLFVALVLTGVLYWAHRATKGVGRNENHDCYDAKEEYKSKNFML